MVHTVSVQIGLRELNGGLCVIWRVWHGGPGSSSEISKVGILELLIIGAGVYRQWRFYVGAGGAAAPPDFSAAPPVFLAALPVFFDTMVMI